jgi:hypothetical protein
MHTLTPLTIYALQIVLVAGCSYLIVELMKIGIGHPPAILAIGMNLALCGLGMALAQLPVRELSLQLLGGTVVAAAAAAGIHGTVRRFQGAPTGFLTPGYRPVDKDSPLGRKMASNARARSWGYRRGGVR